VSPVVFLIRKVDLHPTYIVFKSMSKVQAKWRSE